MKNILIRLGLMAEPSLQTAMSWAAKGVAKLETAIDFQHRKAEVAAAVAKAKQVEADVASQARDDAKAVLQNFKQLLNIK